MAEDMPLSIYLPGHPERMLPDDAIRDTYSLAPGRPCLTFSARVNMKGELLEYNITPGILGEVAYITPDEVTAICGQVLPPVPARVFSVGKPGKTEPPPDRQMLTREDLSDGQTAELQTLHQLAVALHQ